MNVTLSHDRTSVDAANGIFTHLSEVDKKVLDSLVRALIPASPVILEIGSYLGASACVMANALNGRGEVHCVDTWSNLAMSEGSRDTFAEFKANTAKFSALIKPVRAASRDAAAHFGKEIDLLFIDGDHSFEGCRDDLLAWL